MAYDLTVSLGIHVASFASLATTTRGTSNFVSGHIPQELDAKDSEAFGTISDVSQIVRNST